MEYLSPAMSVNSDMTDEELDKYFATYVPLSNLPTPPPAKEQAQPQQLAMPAATTSSPAPEHQVYAAHLAKLIPGTKKHVVAGFLGRAELPDEVVAYAACVLDGLTQRFAMSWRDALVPSGTTRTSPDIIVLAALCLAHGYLVDQLRSSRHWAVKESDGLFSVREIEATKRAMLRDMDYGLFKIRDEAVQDMLGEMQRSTASASKHGRRRTLSIDLRGTAIWSHGVQTPEPSP
ncbi:hypothetical protein BDU57DRAFT_521580 [Ampelomyces quisqualis]|uniref:Cyclin N-terminal domain-containing protein n=1 Tax=Ampelomyces quisqualis TaxID=50730 RepID=A0A6A5QCA2_AMPQU|nr:hypothetical protein BDU57DRAFT_521580 [Ampelomyces quisqualis]